MNKTQVIIHEDKIRELIQKYVEDQCHDSFEVGYGDRRGKIECTNWYGLNIQQEGLVFSLKEVEPA